MEYLGVGSMASVLSKTHLYENETAAVCKEILQAIQFLHQHNIVHRDIKSHNILLGKDWTIKLADFGTSAQLSQNKRSEHHWLELVTGWLQN
ncbi:serine/threonine-protein kinase PAK 1-like [Tachypleus tridentatus]|uniref:serine/threonine-protein kinase PAK 1-like n=1 Tax=Tachypleus tridentatus TaxID=6853 RepID=UPI003FD18948